MYTGAGSLVVRYRVGTCGLAVASQDGAALRVNSARPKSPSASSPSEAMPFKISPISIPTKKVRLMTVTTQTDQGYPQAR
jgi:hypothetical protein